MDKTMNGINFKTILKLVILWIVISAVFIFLYAYFSSAKKVNLRGVLVDNTGSVTKVHE